MNPLVSIIVPIYRIKEGYLQECINSLIGQTYRNVEILLIDDGSPDNCGSICDSYAEKYPSVKAIHQRNQGVSVARNHGLDNATGDYVIFVDADDWIEPDCVEVVLSEIMKRNVDVLYFQRIYEKDNPVTLSVGTARFIEQTEMKPIQLSVIRETLYRNIDFKPPWGKIIKRSFIEKYNLRFPVGIKKSQDVIFNLYLIERIKRAYYLNYVGYHYRFNKGSINHRYNSEMPQIMIRVLEETERFVNQYHNEDADYRKAIGIRAVNMLRTIENTYTLHKDSQLSLSEIRNVTKDYLRCSIVERCLAQCSLSDFGSIKTKARFMLCRNQSLFLYSVFCRIKKPQRMRNR